MAQLDETITTGDLGHESDHEALARKANYVFDVTDFGAVGDGVTDDTAAIQAALTAAGSSGNADVLVPVGTYKVDGTLTITGDDVRLVGQGWGSVVVQSADHTSTIYAYAVSRLTISDLQVYGWGQWSSGWSGVDGHEKGISLRQCSTVRMSGLLLRNNAAVGIHLEGCTGVTVESPVIEGTHAYSAALTANDNNQFGIYVDGRSTYGGNDAIRVLSPDISGTAQGIFSHADAGEEGDIRFLDVDIHDIPGQHGAYIKSSQTVLTGKITNCAYDGMKFQAPSAGLKDCHIPYLVTEDCGDAGVLVSALDGNIQNVTMGAISALRSVRGLVLTSSSGTTLTGVSVGALYAEDSDDYAMLVSGTGLTSGVTVGSINSQKSGKDGIRLDAASDVYIGMALIRDPGDLDVVGSDNGVVVTEATDVRIGILDIQDTQSRMRYGVYVTGAAGELRVLSSAKIAGYTDFAVRAVGTIYEWPTISNLGASPFLSAATVRFSNATTFTAQSVAASNVVLWEQTLDDESAYLITAEIVGKDSGSAERRGSVSSVLIYRDGGVATVEGSADEVADTTSGGFTGVYTWSPTGNNGRLLVHSGAATTIDWKAKVSVVPLAG